jgi:dUTPase
VQDIDFDLSQFGLFLDNDTLFLTVHINSSVKTVGRKIISGDVLELPHLKDPYNLKDVSYALKRFYVVEDVSRASEGFTPTWYPHLYRLKLKQIVDSQEYREILDLPADEDTPGGDTLRDMLSTFEREMQVNESVVEQAEADAPLSGYDIAHYYSLDVDTTANSSTVNIRQVDSDYTTAPPQRAGYQGYLLGDENTPNGNAFGHGIQFPKDPQKGDYFLRTDFAPKRMFQYDGNKWVKVHDGVRMTMTNSQDRRTQKTKYYNNQAWTYNELVTQDVVQLEAGDTEIQTEIPADTQALYLVLKYNTIEKDYVIADTPGLIDSDDSSRIVIRLPNENGVQDSVEYSGAWTVKLYNNREAERQSLSQALRPRSDN